MNDLLRQLFIISLATSAVIKLLLLLTPLLRKPYAARWRYFVWLIVAVRLLIPLAPTLPVALVSIPVLITAGTETSALVDPPQDVLPVPASQAADNTGCCGLYEAYSSSAAVSPTRCGIPRMFYTTSGVTFADGTVRNNPGYNIQLKTSKGKQADVEVW